MTAMSTLSPGGMAPVPGADDRIRRVAGALERGITLLTEPVVVVIAIVEIAILLAGVVARYVFHAPLLWSDELAALLFMWLAIFGAVIALRRTAHMRLTILLDALPARWSTLLQAIASLTVALFLWLILVPAFEYAVDESSMVSPALELSNGWRAAAVFAGCALMTLVATQQLLETHSVRDCLLAAALIALVGVALWIAAPILKGWGNYNLLVFFLALVAATILAGVPIGFAFGIATLAYLALMTHMPLTIVVSRTQEGMSHLILLSVPLFIFLGLLIEMTGMALAMVNLLVALLGHIRGGLSYALLGAMYLVSGISGAKAADMAAVAPVLFPEMKRRGTKPGELVALLSTSAAMSETIPPSLVLITIGSVTDVSISALFTGGLLPALVLAIALGLVARYRARDEDLSAVTRANVGDLWRATFVAIPAIALPFVIRSAVVEGVATATEVSTIGIVYTVLCGLILYRRFDWKKLYPMLVDTAALTGAILFIIGTATAMAWALTQSGFSRDLIKAMTAMPGGAAGFIAVSIVAFILLGAILEGIPALVLFAPLAFPIARALGIHEVHYAMIVILAMGVGLFAPPVGVGYYMACAIGRVDPVEGMRPIWPYLLALFAGLLVVALVPWLSVGFL